MARKKQAMEESKKAAGSAGVVAIVQPRVLEVCLEVSGTSDLIQNNFGQKIVEQMLRKHMGFSVTRETKKPREALEAAKILNAEDRNCIPPVAFKAAMLTAATQIKGMKKTQLRTQLFVAGNSIPFTFEEFIPRMDMVRTAGIGRVPDVRFRPSFVNWKARLAIQFADALNTQTVVDLLNRAGKVGVGEWRPEKNGTFGTFTVTRYIHDADEQADVHAECSVPIPGLKIPEWALDAEIDPATLRKIFGEAEEQAGAANGVDLEEGVAL